MIIISTSIKKSDFSLSDTHPRGQKSISSKNLKSYIYKGTYKSHPACIKIYIESSPGNGGFSCAMSEIKIYEELSKLADKYCFLAYYGSCTYEVNGIRQLALIMQWADKSLAEYLKESQCYIPEDQLKTWYIKLFESYYELNNQKIYYLDIKPHNILIDENLFLYIIDFDVSIQEIEIKTISVIVDTFAVSRNFLLNLR